MRVRTESARGVREGCDVDLAEELPRVVDAGATVRAVPGVLAEEESDVEVENIEVTRASRAAFGSTQASRLCEFVKLFRQIATTYFL